MIALDTQNSLLQIFNSITMQKKGNNANHLFKLLHVPMPGLVINNAGLTLTQNASDLGIGLIVIYVYRIP